MSESLYYDDETESVEEFNTFKDSNTNYDSGKPDAGKSEETGKRIFVIVNGQAVALSGKDSYIFVDILDFYPFDTSVMGGRDLIMTVNDEKAEFSTPVSEGDIIEMYWEK